MQTPYYDPKLSEEEIAAIRQTVAVLRWVDRRIISVTVQSDGEVRVRTGFVAGPLAGAGNEIYLKRQNGGWEVTLIGNWIS